MIRIPRQKKSKVSSIINEEEDNFNAKPPVVSDSFDVLLDDEDSSSDIIEKIGIGIDEEDDSNGTEWEREDEELEEEDVNKKEQQEEDHLTEDELENIVDGADISDSDIDEDIIQEEDIDKESAINSDELPIKKESTTVEELEREQEYARRLSVLAFLTEYAKDINRTVDEVAQKVNIPLDKARDNLNEYVNIVKDTVNKKTYPDGLLTYYNNEIQESSKRIKYHHLNSLKDLVKRYSMFDINKTLNNNGNDTFISNKLVSNSDNPLSLLSGNSSSTNNNNWADGHGGNSNSNPYSSPPPSNQPSQPPQSDYNDIDHLKDGITSMQLIRFGLGNIFGPTARMKICNVMGFDTTPYLMDEYKMKELLLMSGATETRATQFINWLKTNARYVSHPIGFLASSMPSSGQPLGQQPQQSSPYYGAKRSGSSYGPNAMDDYYYQIRVYTEGFPPDHPVNVQALKDHLEQKRQDDQLKAVDKQLSMAIRMQMMKSFGSMDGSGNNHSNSLFSPEMMIMMGMARWRNNGTDENGKPIWVVEPTFGQPPNGGSATSSADQTNQLTAVMTMMKEMMSLTQSLNKADPTQQSFMQTVMQGLATKMFEPQTNKMQEVLETAKLLQTLKGPDPAIQTMGGITDPEVIIKTKRMELDKEFGMRRLDLEKQELDLQRERLSMQDREASANMDKIMEGVQQFAPMLVGMFQQFFMGNRGGGQQQPGQPPGGGMVTQAGTENPAQLIMKMEYEKQRIRQQEEARMRQREWEEELRRKNMETEMMRARNQAMNMNNQQHYVTEVPQPQEETQRVVIKEPDTVIHERRQQQAQQEVYNEETFLPYSSSELEEVLNKAAKEKKKLEEYINTVGKVYQSKVMGGDGHDYEIIENEARRVTHPQNNQMSATRVEQQQPQSLGEMLDNYPHHGRIDPDYDGVGEDDDDDDDEETEEVEDINNNSDGEEESVEY